MHSFHAFIFNTDKWTPIPSYHKMVLEFICITILMQWFSFEIKIVNKHSFFLKLADQVPLFISNTLCTSYLKRNRSKGLKRLFVKAWYKWQECGKYQSKVKAKYPVKKILKLIEKKKKSDARYGKPSFSEISFACMSS